jgi:hypothetical protein
VADKEALGLANEENKLVIDFLENLGVATYPRPDIVVLGNKDLDFLSYQKFTLSKLSFPYTTSYGNTYRAKQDLVGNLSVGEYYGNAVVKKFEYFQEILASGDLYSIVSWILNDEEISLTKLSDYGSFPPAKLEFKTNSLRSNRNLRRDEIFNYLVWKFQNTAWVKTEIGINVRPCQCIISSQYKGFEPLFFSVNFDFGKFPKSQRKQIEAILERLGFCFSISDFSEETVYKLLLDLPIKDPKGKIAGSLYRKIIENFKLPENHSESYYRFIGGESPERAEGKILAKRIIDNEEIIEYQPISKVFYVDNPNFCGDIRQHFAIAVLPKRRGNDKIKRFFGVNPLKDVKFELSSTPVRHSLFDVFNKNFELSKPYLLTYRIDKVNENTLETQFTNLKQLQITICSNLEVSLENKSVKINNYEYISTAIEKNKIYILLTEDYSSVKELNADIKFRSVVADIVCGVFKIESGQEILSQSIAETDLKRKKSILEITYPDDWQEKLRTAQSYFNSSTRAQNRFWEICLEAKGFENVETYNKKVDDIYNLIIPTFPIEEFDEIFQELSYEEINDSANYNLLKRLFDSINLTVEDYNQYATYEEIDFSEKHKADLRRTYDKRKGLITLKLHQFLKNKDVKEQKTFKKQLAILESVRYLNCVKGFDFEPEQVIENYLTDKGYSLVIDWDEKPELDLMKEVYSVNKKELESLTNQQEELEVFLKDDINGSLLYFNKVSYLKELFDNERQSKKLNEPLTNATSSNNHFVVAASYMKSAISKKSNLSNFNGQSTKSGSKKFGFSGERKSVSDREKQNIGFAGEKSVYEYLLQSKAISEVHWESKNGERAGVKPVGDDSLGYDIRYVLKENEEERFVEVKATPRMDNEFYISFAELRFAESKGAAYELYFVKDVFGKPKIHNLGNIFIDEEPKFRKEADKYKILGFELNEIIEDK